MVTFVQATYALATFVHISNISSVIGSILTKLFGSKFWGVIMCVDQNVLGPNFFRPKCFSDSKYFSDPKFFQTKFFFLTHNFLIKGFRTPNFSTFLSSKIFFGPINFGGTISLDQKVLDQNFFCGLGDFHWRQGIKPFQVEHFRLESCFD